MGVEEGAGHPGPGDQHELRQEVGEKAASFRGLQELSLAAMKSICGWWGGGRRQGRQAGVRSSALTSEAQVMWKDLKWETGAVRLEECYLRDREGSPNCFCQECATARAKQGLVETGRSVGGSPVERGCQGERRNRAGRRDLR